jgi:AraC-like DNA-binding protein
MILFACITAAFILLLSLVFAWRGSMPERTFLKRIGSTRVIRSKNENMFMGLKQLYAELAENISAMDSRLESSLDIIENQTRLIRAQTIDRIRQALKFGDEAAACTILRDCSAALPKPEVPLIAGLVAGMLAAMLRELKAEYPELLAGVETPDYAPGAQEELFDRRFPACFARICECIRADKEKNISNFDYEVLDYINEHLYDPNLYITAVSERFSISPPTLQKLVRQNSGQTFLVYVEKRRLARACELLAGRHNIAETAGICGFSSASSFSRAFKRSYGFSPSRLLNSTTPLGF